MTCLMMEVLLLALLFMIGTALALLDQLQEQRSTGSYRGEWCQCDTEVVAMVFAAGIFMDFRERLLNSIADY